MPELYTEVRIALTLPTGRTVRPSFYIGYAGGATAITPTELPGVAEAVAGAVTTGGLMANFTNGITFRHVEVQNFHIAPPGTEQPPANPDGKGVADTITYISDATDAAGTILDDTLPPRNATIHMWTSGIAGTKGRNWSFWPPLAEGEVNSSGVITSARVNALGTSIAALVTAANAAADPDSVMVQVSFKNDDVLAATQLRVQPNVRTRRRWSQAL